MLSTEHGLFVFTANPFNGTQIWRLDDTAEFGITHKAPVTTTDKTFTFKIQATIPEDKINDITAEINVPGAYVLVNLPTITADGRTGDIRFNVTLTDGKYTETITEVVIYEYLITIILPEDYTGDFVITFDGVDELKGEQITITAQKTSPQNSTSWITGAIIGVCVGNALLTAAIITGLLFYLRRKKNQAAV